MKTVYPAFNVPTNSIVYFPFFSPQIDFCEQLYLTGLDKLQAEVVFVCVMYLLHYGDISIFTYIVGTLLPSEDIKVKVVLH